MGTWNAIYLGNFASIAPNEGNNREENASSLVGESFGGPGDPILADEVTVTTYDGGGTNNVLDMNNDNGSYDLIYTDIGDGEQWYRFDGVATYNASVTYVDGTSDNVVVVIFQDTAGNTFLAPSLSNTGNAVLNDAPLQSLTLNSVNGNRYSGLAVQRSQDVFLACFVRGTLIETANGPRYIETLKQGDLVMTRDRGAQPLVWTGGRKVDGTGDLAPVHFAAGALGNIRPLLVSPNHRILITGWEAELHFGQDEVLVPAKGLINGTTIRQDPVDFVTYHHILFDQHEVVLSEGIYTESFPPGRALLTHDRHMYQEMVTIFPELAHPDFEAPFPTARPCLKPYEARLLAA